MNSATAAPITDVLLPTDGSERSEAAVDHALELAARCGARVHALYVVDAGSVPVGFEEVSIDPGPVIDALEDAGEAATGRVAEAARDHGVDVERVVRQGRVHDAILEYVDEAGIDVVVMGTHGREGVERQLLGSVTERVIRLSAVPVLAVPPADGPGATEYGNVLLPVKDRESATVARARAFDVARHYGATVHVLHVVEAWTGDVDERRRVGQRLVESIGSDAEDESIDVRTDVRTGVPYEEINGYVAAEGIDLIVMATHGRTGVDRLVVGSVTEIVLRTTAVPVLTCHPPSGE